MRELNLENIKIIINRWLKASSENTLIVLSEKTGLETTKIEQILTIHNYPLLLEDAMSLLKTISFNAKIHFEYDNKSSYNKIFNEPQKKNIELNNGNNLMNLEQVGYFVREEREKMNLNQIDFAKKCGISKNTLLNIENSRHLSFHSIKKICAFLNYKIDDLSFILKKV